MSGESRRRDDLDPDGGLEYARTTVSAGGTGVVSGSRRSLRGWLRSPAAPPVETLGPSPDGSTAEGSPATSPVAWVPSAVPGAPRAMAEQVIAAYRAIGRWPLPEDFLDIAAEHQGVRPVPFSFDLPGGITQDVEHLLHFESESFSNLVTRRFPLEDVLDDGVVPFAECLGSGVLCFDFRADRDAPVVAYWSTGTGLVPLASSFTAFVALLHH